MRHGSSSWMTGIPAWNQPVLRLLARRAALSALTLAFVLTGAAEIHAQANPPLKVPNQSTFLNSSTARTPKEQQVFGQTKGGIAGPLRKGDATTPLYLNADELEYDTRGNRVIARGNVEIYYNGYALKADRVVYDQAANTITAEGNARVQEPDGAVVSAERLVTSADFAEAFGQSLSVIGKDDTRIVARRSIRRDGNITEFEQGKFTPCRNDPGKPPLWCIAAQRMIHDKQEATISYQDAQFELFGMPIFYMPYFQHADPSVKSRTGFMMPEYSSYSRLGIGIETPYHIALDPSYDVLFNPMYLSKQGVLWQGQWRHKVRIGQVQGTYDIKVAGIEQNNDQSINAALHERWRGSIQSRGSFSLSSWWTMGWDVIGESDKAFRQFYRLDNVLQKDRINSVYLNGRSERNFFGLTMYHVGGLVLNESLDTLPPGTPASSIVPNLSQSAPSRVAPVMDYNYIFANPVLGGEMRFNANAVAYWQDLTFTDGNGLAQRANGNTTRVTASFDWRRTLTDTIGQRYTPFASLRGDITTFSETVDPITRTLRLSLGDADCRCGSHRRAHRPGHCAQPERRSAPVAQPRLPQSGVRRHEPVRDDKDVVPRQDRYRRARQLRLAVYLSGKYWRLDAVPGWAEPPFVWRQHIYEPRRRFRRPLPLLAGQWVGEERV
jgi:LPS-assembly protein